MASVSIPMPLGQSPFDPALSLPTSTKPIHSRRTSRNPRLTPLPNFSFNPGAEASQDKEDSAQTSSARPTAELPAFSFNPGAAMSDESPSPTHPILEEMALNSSRAIPKPFSFGTEAYKTPSPTKTHFTLDSPNPRTGHRRGTSEFIGAEGTGLSSSPPKSSLTPPPTRPARSHQHRRSQAVSITEIETSDLIKANAIAKARAGSVPTSPTGMSRDHFSRASQSISSLYDRTPSTSPPRRASASGARPRVGFSDTVEMIPRPLSMISSETEGSVSTVRGGHSLTGSISSLGSPAPRSAPSPSPEESSPTPRPRTADAASPRSVYIQADNHSDSSVVLKRPLSATSSTNFSYPNNKKRYWFSPSTETSPSATPRPTSNTERGDPLSSFTAFAPASSPSSTQSRPKTSPERKNSIRKRKVRTLAGAIFSRKARSRVQGRGRRTPTPPLSRLSQDMDSIFDDDSTVVLRESPSKSDQTSVAPCVSTYEGPFMTSQHTSETTSPIIDLDAALGPFGSEQKFPQYGFAAARNRMHSSMGRGPADMFANAHRRADSAPLMPAVNRAGFTAPSMNGSSVAEDVFDEGEEDEFLAEESRSESGTEGSAPKPRTVSSTTPSEADRTVRPATSRTSSRSPIGLAISTQVADGIEIVDAEDLSREAARSSDSTLTAPTVPADEAKQANASPMQFGYPVPQSSYASSGEGRSAPGSAISSPDADHLHFDQYPRFSRPASERSPDTGIRSSTEDVPSLCDSVSTGNVARFSGGAGSRSSADQRSGSFSAPSTSRSTETPKAWKRASLASLNKLIPNAAGSKSRLRFEEAAPHEEQEPAKKSGRRISKLMRFWKSKEKEGR